MTFDIDHSSSGAQSYQQLFEKLLADARVKNDGLDLDEVQTQRIRGRISLLKELLALPNQKKVMDAQARFGHPEE